VRVCGGREGLDRVTRAPVDHLQIDRRLLALVERSNELIDRLGPIRCAIVDGLRASID
jgi:hypothetical protein